MSIEIEPEIRDLARAVAERGGRALVAGDGLRERLLGRPTHGIDLDVHGLERSEIRAIAERTGGLVAAKRSASLKLLIGRGVDRIEVRVLPVATTGKRRSRRRGTPADSVRDAAATRMFTVDAIAVDPLTLERVDPFDGSRDLADGVLRLVEPSAVDDRPIAPLRGARLAGALGLTPDPDTARACRSTDVGRADPVALWGEIEALLVDGARPSVGLEVLRQFDVLRRIAPELDALADCPQDPDAHPEGDAWTHTKLVAAEARRLLDDLARADAVAVMLAALCHDTGKHSATNVVAGRILAAGHDAAGVAPSRALLGRLRVAEHVGQETAEAAVALVEHHLAPSRLFRAAGRSVGGTLRRLARRIDLELLYRVALSDGLGRGESARTSEAASWFREAVSDARRAPGAPRPLLVACHLPRVGPIEGPRVHAVLDEVYDLQIAGEVSDLESARAVALRLLARAAPGNTGKGRKMP